MDIPEVEADITTIEVATNINTVGAFILLLTSGDQCIHLPIAVYLYYYY